MGVRELGLLLFFLLGSIGMSLVLPKFWRGEMEIHIPNEDVVLRRRFQIPDFALAFGRLIPLVWAFMLLGLVAITARIAGSMLSSTLNAAPAVALRLHGLVLAIYVAGFPFMLLVATTGWPRCVIPPRYRRRVKAANEMEHSKRRGSGKESR